MKNKPNNHQVIASDAFITASSTAVTNILQGLDSNVNALLLMNYFSLNMIYCFCLCVQLSKRVHMESILARSIGINSQHSMVSYHVSHYAPPSLKAVLRY